MSTENWSFKLMALVEDSFSDIQLEGKKRKKELCNKRPSWKKTIHVN